jgi:hypothetical protein
MLTRTFGGKVVDVTSRRPRHARDDTASDAHAHTRTPLDSLPHAHMFTMTSATCAPKHAIGATRSPIANQRSTRTVVVARAEKNAGRVTKASEDLAEKFTVGGGGDDGFCDYNDVKEAIKECEGLEGAKLEACYASYGCNVESVTDHYAKAAGIEPKTDKK